MHNSCDTLPLSVFIDCLCDSNYTGMGGSCEEENKSLWQDCFEEYILLVNRDNMSYSMVLTFEIMQLELIYTSVDRSIELLHQVRDNEIVELLQSEGIRLRFNDKDRASYFNDLRKARKYADRILFEIENKGKMLESLQGNNTGSKIDRQWFNDDIASLNKYLKFPINRGKTSVAMYASYKCLAIQEYNKSQAKQTVNNG